jgi:CubicO group peptidase (beta-lactamase class C family)
LPALACSSSSSSSSSPSDPGAPTPAPSSTAPPAVTAPPAPAANALADAVDALFTDSSSRDTFSGSVIVVDGGQQVLAKGYGFADRTSKRKNTPDTIFRVGSVSKQFALTDPVSKFFPDYPAENLVLDGTVVTLQHLLSHTSGLPDPAGTAGFKAAIWRRPIAPSEQVGFAQTLPLVAKPGSTFAYLNFNFLLAALIVEKTSGLPYGTFIQQRFFGPLAMADSGTVMPASAAPRAAVGYYEDSTNTLASFEATPGFADPDVTVAFGAGQVYSTVLDLAKWDRALTGEKVLAAAQRDLLFTPNLDDYGFGWVIEKQSNVTIEWHNGALEPLGFSAMIVRVPSKDRFVAYLSNFDYPLISPFEPKVEALVVK